ncbi:MAG: hypothetical protein ACD_28C00035G0006 [uncultured bacterium]|nr:MAG: hypothetical protein ACD_28C00035G0006 [uncultured bacterium]KKT73671.1 MAG: hypothetical protein UW70_C0078G0002 [Candidatus Peregrinibacteria bacterium GW2011_GWA2_44_7]
MATTQTPKTLTLTLEDGTQWTGESFGAYTEASGEVVFNTGMVGYPESFSDPSYTGQILILTYPLVGNYGIPSNEKDTYGLEKYFESEGAKITAVIVSEYSNNHNHWQSKTSLSDWLKKYNIPGISGIDTRALTKRIRTSGAQLGMISPSGKKPKSFYDPNKENLVAKVSIKEPVVYKAGKKHIALVDCGMKLNILRNFLNRDISVTRVPWNYNPWQLKTHFDGIFFSNGPGDPAIMKETVAIMKESFTKNVPIFGICLGTQIMGIAAGAKTYKMKFGHRSHNQPCVDLETGRCYITSQNHGFAVDRKTLPKDWKVWMENANDKSVEGIKHIKKPWFSVQFHPEATAGPTDTNHLFDQFIQLL